MSMCPEIRACLYVMLILRVLSSIWRSATLVGVLQPTCLKINRMRDKPTCKSSQQADSKAVMVLLSLRIPFSQITFVAFMQLIRVLLYYSRHWNSQSARLFGGPQLTRVIHLTRHSSSF